MDDDNTIEDLLKLPFGSRDYGNKSEIVLKGRPTPSLIDLWKATKRCVRHFNDEWYSRDRWLCGSKKRCALFCWPCLLFSSESNVWTTKGLSDVANYYVLKKRHEATISHISSKISLQKFGNIKVEGCCNLAVKITRDKYNAKVKSNRYIVSCLIDTVCLQVEQELSFLEHSGSIELKNKENFIQLLHHRAKFDERLRNHMENSSVFNETSRSIQMHLIDAVAAVLVNKIKEEVREAPYISVILDEATDINRKSQISCVLRYVLSSGLIQERFVKIIVGENQSPDSIVHRVDEILSEFDCKNKLVAQTYDGCSVMAGVHKELQKLIRDKHKSALFVHCYEHKLSSVIIQLVESIKECSAFFETLNGFSSFFSRCAKRKDSFDTFCQKYLPSFTPSRWIQIEKLVEIVPQCKANFIMYLDSIANDSNEWDGETRAFCRGFRSILMDFDFNFLLNLFFAVLPQLNSLFNILQKHVNDGKYCLNEVQKLIQLLNEKETNFEEFWEQIEEEFDLEYFKDETPPKKIKFSIVNDDKKASYYSLYLNVLCTMTEFLIDRFSNIEELQFLSLVDRSRFQTNLLFPIIPFDSLIKSYGTHFNAAELKSELSVVYASEEFNKNSTSELYTYLTMTGLSSALPEVTKLCALLLTLPVFSATVEKRCSTMKRMHTYLRNTNTQEQISNVTFLVIEKNLLKALESIPTFYDSVIDIFATKDRLLELTYEL